MKKAPQILLVLILRPPRGKIVCRTGAVRRRTGDDFHCPACSLLSCFPSPFVVLDEVDAALDDANTIRFGQILVL